MILRAIIIDDEPAGREMLERELIEYCPNVDVLQSCETALEGIETIRNEKPDLVFLDVELSDNPKDFGHEILKRVKDIDFAVIFVSAHPKYAIKAFDIQAADFLHKSSYTPDRLKQAIQNVIEKHGNLAMRSNLEKISEEFKRSKTICLRSSEKIEFVEISNVIYCEAFGGITKFYLANSKMKSITKPIGKVAEWLKPHDFIRVHDSFLVNFNNILEYSRKDSNLIMINQKTVPISKARRPAFLDKIREFSL